MPSAPTTNTSESPATLRLIAVAFAAAALWFVYLGAFRPPGLHAPAGIMYVLAVLLVLTSLRVLELSSGEPGAGDWYGMLAFAGFSVVAWWMALSRDPVQCSISGFFAFVIPHSGAICRAALIIGAVLFSLVPLFLAWRFFSQRFSD